jgi:hypothetical protein
LREDVWRMYGSDGEAYSDALAQLEDVLGGGDEALTGTIGLHDPRREAAWRSLGGG